MKLYDSIFTSAPGLMAAIEQYPFGAAALFGLIAYVAWLKYRRK